MNTCLATALSHLLGRAGLLVRDGAAVHHALPVVNLLLEALGGVPPGLLRNRHVALAALLAVVGLAGGRGALHVAGDEEAHEEVGQGREVEDVEPDGKRLARGGDAGLGDLDDFRGSNGLAGGRLHDHLGGSGGSSPEDELLERVKSTSGSRDSGGCWRVDDRLAGDDRLGGNGDGNDDGDEGVDHGVRGTEQELGDLHCRESALNHHWHLDGEGSNSVVSVLETVSSTCITNSTESKLTIKAWIKELTRTKTQMGADM